MTTERQAAANRSNAKRSTGPLSAAGKAIVARNATKHGAFSALPVIPGVERPEDWDAHRAGVVQSLAPVGLLETSLAERAASLLWRLQRVARFEVCAIAVGLEEAADPPAPDPFAGPESNAVQLKEAMEELEKQRGVLATAEARQCDLRALEGAADADPFDPDSAFGVLEDVHGELPEDAPCQWIEEKEFLSPLGLSPDDAYDDAPWTAGLVRRAVASIAKQGKTTPEKLLARAVRDAQQQHDEATARIKSLSDKVKALERKRQLLIGRTQARRLLPEDAAEEKVLRYEAHLSRQLSQTLHELERLQANRAERQEPPPLPVEVRVYAPNTPGDESAP
jgi:hypothetical protein